MLHFLEKHFNSQSSGMVISGVFEHYNCTLTEDFFHFTKDTKFKKITVSFKDGGITFENLAGQLTSFKLEIVQWKL